MISNSSETNTIIDGSKPKIPNCPLTAYNLFYKYKRFKILEASNTGLVTDKKDVRQLVHATPGLENYPSTMRSMIPPDRLDEIRRTIVRLALDQQLLASDNNKKRSHKRSGKGSSYEMNTVMVEGWKKSDDFSKAIFKELAEDGKREYHCKLAAYYQGSQSKISVTGEYSPSPKIPEAVCNVPCKTPSNTKASLQGLNVDAIVHIPFVRLPLMNDLFKLSEVSHNTSRAMSFNGGNSFGDVTCFAESAYYQCALHRQVKQSNHASELRTTNDQYQNIVGCSGMSIQNMQTSKDLELKTPEEVPCKTTSNMKDGLQGLNIDSLVPISVVYPSCVEKKHSIAAIMGNVTLLNDSFEHPLGVTPSNSRSRSFNGGNSFGDATCFEANAHHQNTYGRITQPNNTSVSRTTSYQCQNMAEMSTQDVHRDTESDDDFMNMINRTLK